MSDIHIHIDRETPVKVITLEPNGARGASATISVGTTTTGSAGTNASVTNSGTSSAAVFNFTIPRGATGAAGPNSVTSATTSDGTAQLSIDTLDVNSIESEGGIVTVGQFAPISTSGSDAGIYTYGSDAHIYTVNGGYIQTSSTFKITDGTFTTTLSGTQTANRAISFPNASGTIALTSDIPPQEVKSANFTAADKGAYVSVATLTVTDPTPSEGASFSILVRNGTATVGGTAYSVAGTLIRRVFHSGAWANYPYSSALFGANVATYLATPTVANWRAATSGTSDLVTVGPNEVSITGATTLTSTAFGLIHVCSGTSADYQVDLPSVSGNAGRIITIRMSNALTRFVTIAGAGGALIDGLATRLMWAQESCVLMCDGTSWTKIAGKSRPMVFSGENGAGVTVANATNVPISIATILQNNTGLMNDTVSSIVVCRIRRAGVYALSALATLNRSGSFAGFEAYGMIFLNATTSLATAPAMLAVVPTAIDSGGLNTYAHVNYAITRTLAANDYLCLGTFQNTGGNMTTRTVNVVRPNISVTEIPNW